MSQSKKAAKQDTKSTAAKEVVKGAKPIAKPKVEKVKGPKPDYTPKKTQAVAIAGHHKSGPNPLHLSLQRHIDIMSADVPLDFFLDHRAAFWDARTMKAEQRPDAEAKYKAAVEKKAETIRLRAFDMVVHELSRQLRTEDPNLLLPALRKERIRYHEGKVQLSDGGGVWTSPPVFLEYAYDLVPKVRFVPKADLKSVPKAEPKTEEGEAPAANNGQELQAQLAA